jgi:hypothetical protein
LGICFSLQNQQIGWLLSFIFTKKISMGKFYNSILPAHQQFIKEQHLFFVGTAPLSGDGRVNVSPKGLDCLVVLDEKRVAYMDLTGSGNETSAHSLENGRITFMFCSFDKKPLILRLYGKGYTVLPGTAGWQQLAPRFTIYPSTRQLIVAGIDLVQTSCGFAVPMFNYSGERAVHFDWAATKDADGLQDYRLQNNLKSIDGLPTDIALQQQ